MNKITDTELNDYKKSFDSYKDMNKVVYFCLMKLGNDYNIIKRDLENSVKWSSIIYDKDTDFMNNWYFFNNYILTEYEDKSFYDYLLLMDLTLKKLYKEEKVIYVNEYGFENNKELMKKFGLNHYKSYSEIIEKVVFDNWVDNMITYFNQSINWTEIMGKFENDKLLNKILNNIGNKNDFYVMKLGKLNDFVKNKYE